MRSYSRSAIALLAAVALTAGSPSPAVPSKPDDKTILHVLNRIGFGARPGDVERVRQVGLAKYIEQQLNPERVADEGMKARLAGFPTLAMSSRQLAEDYYVPALEMRRQAQRAAGNDPAMQRPDGPPPNPNNDGRPARTPGRHALAVPSPALGEAMVGEWQAQGEDIDPAVFTRAAEIAKRFIHDHQEKVEEELVFAQFKKAGRMVEIVGVLTSQHAAGAKLTDKILAAAPQARNKEPREAMGRDVQALCAMYRPHMAREATDVFPALRHLVTADE